MKSPAYELQKAILGRLSGAISCPVYDAVPTDAAFPYVTIGEDTAADWSSKTTSGQDVTTTIHVWSRYKGKAEAKRIGSEVLQQLTTGPLSMTGFSADPAQLDMEEYLVDADGITQHGVLRLRLYISEEG